MMDRLSSTPQGGIEVVKGSHRLTPDAQQPSFVSGMGHPGHYVLLDAHESNQAMEQPFKRQCVVDGKDQYYVIPSEAGGMGLQDIHDQQAMVSGLRAVRRKVAMQCGPGDVDIGMHPGARVPAQRVMMSGHPQLHQYSDAPLPVGSLFNHMGTNSPPRSEFDLPGGRELHLSNRRHQPATRPGMAYRGVPPEDDRGRNSDAEAVSMLRRFHARQDMSGGVPVISARESRMGPTPQSGSPDSLFVDRASYMSQRARGHAAARSLGLESHTPDGMSVNHPNSIIPDLPSPAETHRNPRSGKAEAESLA